MEHHDVLVLRLFFPIFDSFMQMDKEHVATIFGYGRSNGGINVQAWASIGLQIVGSGNGALLEIDASTL